MAPQAPQRVHRPEERHGRAQELGDTIGVSSLRAASDGGRRGQYDLARKRVGDERRYPQFVEPKPRNPAAPPEPVGTRSVAIVVAAGALALGAVLVAVLWPSAPPVRARPRADADGRDAVELTCKSCPDGTQVSIGNASAVMAGGSAVVTLPTSLTVGSNLLRVAIDRPGTGRDETVTANVEVAYRIRADLGALDAERPALQIVADVAPGTSLTIAGRSLVPAQGRAVESIDVSDACTGLASEVRTVSRQVPYVVTPEKGAQEKGVVDVSVGIVPLQLDSPFPVGPGGARSPKPHVVTSSASFVLAGRTMRGAELIAAGRPIPVQPDGSFNQTMNVSANGSTELLLRAKAPGLAPRIATIRVRRVESLEVAVNEFLSSEAPVRYGAIAADLPGAVGKAVMLSGEVSDIKKVGVQTIVLLQVSTASGCATGQTCTVRLVQTTESVVKRGDAVRVYGHVSRIVSLAGRSDAAEVEVDVALKGQDPATESK